MQEKLYLKDAPQYHCFAVPGCVQLSQALGKHRITALPEIITAPGSTLKAFGENVWQVQELQAAGVYGATIILRLWENTVGQKVFSFAGIPFRHNIYK